MAARLLLSGLRQCWLLLQELQGRQEQLKEQMQAVKEQMNEQHQRVAKAQQELAAAKQAAAERLQALGQAMRRPGLQAPASAAEARQLLVQVQQQAAEEQQRWVCPPAWSKASCSVSTCQSPAWLGIGSACVQWCLLSTLVCSGPPLAVWLLSQA